MELYPGVDVSEMEARLCEVVKWGKGKSTVVVLDDLHVADGAGRHVVPWEWVRGMVERREVAVGEGHWIGVQVRSRLGFDAAASSYRESC